MPFPFPPSALHFPTLGLVSECLTPPAFLSTRFFLCTTTRPTPVIPGASVICRACVCTCTCAGHKAVLVSAKQATNIVFFACESSWRPLYSLPVLNGVLRCDAFPQKVPFHLIFLSHRRARVFFFFFVAALRLCSCPCWKKQCELQ